VDPEVDDDHNGEHVDGLVALAFLRVDPEHPNSTRDEPGNLE
jgi:hypothetical protein